MSDLKVVPLPPQTDATADLIAVLEATLERAKAGDLLCFVLTAQMRSGGFVSARHAPSPNRHALLGGLSREMHELTALILSEREADILFQPDPPSVA